MRKIGAHMTQADMRRLLTPAQLEQMASTTAKLESDLIAARATFPVGTRVRSTFLGAEGHIVPDLPGKHFTFRIKLDDGRIVRQAPDCLDRIEAA